MLGPVARLSQQLGRNVMRNTLRHGSSGGIPGQNLPFNIENRTRFTLVFFTYVMTGIGAPFLILDWQMRKM